MNTKPSLTQSLFTTLSTVALALAASATLAGEPENGAQARPTVQRQAAQRQIVQRPSVQRQSGPSLGGWQKMTGLATRVDTPIATTGTYSKTLTFTLSTTQPAPPPAGPGAIRTFKSRTGHLLETGKAGNDDFEAGKGGNDVATEKLVIVYESMDVEDDSIKKPANVLQQ